MWAEKSWTFQSSRLKERGKLQKSPGETETPQGSQAWDAAVRRAKESCPLPIGFKSSTDQVSKEICPVAARTNGLEADTSLGSTDSVEGKIFAIKL